MILHSHITVAAAVGARRGLLRKMMRFDTRASDRRRRGRWWATHLYLAQPIRAGLSTVKTSTLTTRDHNRAYLHLSQARALSFFPLVAAAKAISPFTHLSLPDALSRILSRNFEPTGGTKIARKKERRERERKRGGEVGREMQFI